MGSYVRLRNLKWYQIMFEEYIAGIENISNATRNAKDTCCGVISCNAKVVKGSSNSSKSVESAKAEWGICGILLGEGISDSVQLDPYRL